MKNAATVSNFLNLSNGNDHWIAGKSGKLKELVTLNIVNLVFEIYILFQWDPLYYMRNKE